MEIIDYIEGGVYLAFFIGLIVYIIDGIITDKKDRGSYIFFAVWIVAMIVSIVNWSVGLAIIIIFLFYVIADEYYNKA